MTLLRDDRGVTHLRYIESRFTVCEVKGNVFKPASVVSLEGPDDEVTCLTCIASVRRNYAGFNVLA